MRYSSDLVNVTSVSIFGKSWTQIDRMIVKSRNDSSSVEIHRVHLDHDRVLVGVAFVGAILAIFILMAIVGNVLVVVAIITERNLRRAGNNFLISLAVADTLVACLVMTFAAANDLTGRWSFGEVFCVLWQSSDVMCCTASILNICAVSLDRYIHIRDPLRYRSLVTHRRSLIVVSVIWTMSAILSFLPISLGWHRLGKTDSPNMTQSSSSSSSSPSLSSSSLESDYFRLNSSTVEPQQSSNDSSVDDSICHLDLNPWYACISSAISFYIPCIVMLVIYIRLYRLSLKHRKFMTSVTGPGGDPQRSRSPKYPSSELVAPEDGCTLVPDRDRQSDIDLCQGHSPKHRSEISRTVPGVTSPAGPNDLQAVPVVTITGCSDLDGGGGDLSTGRFSNGAGVEGVRGNRRLLGATESLPPARRYSTLSIRLSNPRPSIISGSLARQTDHHKAAITVGCIIGIFLFCWGPFFVINIIGSVWEGSIHPFAFVFFTWLGYINSCANPIIYGITNVEFRRAFLRILTSRCYPCHSPCHHPCQPSCHPPCHRTQCPAGRRQEWTDNNNSYRQVRTNDSPLTAYGITS